MLIGKKTCQLAIDTFGEDSQKKMAVEGEKKIQKFQEMYHTK